MSERLCHYSIAPLHLRSLRSRVQEISHKPKGLWVSVIDEHGDGWRDWCEAENFRLDSLAHARDIEFRDDARVMRLSTARDIDSFTDAYGVNSAGYYYSIDWPRVASEHQAIVIAAPYAFSRRLTPHTSWYYPWDCASGCVWDVSAIVGVRVCRLCNGPLDDRDGPTACYWCIESDRADYAGITKEEARYDEAYDRWRDE